MRLDGDLSVFLGALGRSVVVSAVHCPLSTVCFYFYFVPVRTFLVSWGVEKEVG